MSSTEDILREVPGMGPSPHKVFVRLETHAKRLISSTALVEEGQMEVWIRSENWNGGPISRC